MSELAAFLESCLAADEADHLGFDCQECGLTSARVLAEVEAWRKIIAAFVEEGVRKDIFNRGYDDGLLNEDDMRQRLAANARWAGLEVAVRIKAETFADRPGYDPRWAL